MRAPALALAVLLVACSSSDGGGPAPSNPRVPTAEPRLDSEVTIPFDGTATIEGESLSLRFTQVAEDSRCPMGVQCVWAGQATVVLVAAHPSAAEEMLTLTIPGERDHADYAQYTVTLVALDPYPTADHHPQESEYLATVVVSRR